LTWWKYLWFLKGKNKAQQKRNKKTNKKRKIRTAAEGYFSLSLVSAYY